MLETGPVDHHFGQMSWGKETGFGNYDVKIARNLYLDAVQYMIDNSRHINFNKILFVMGHDFFNVDNQANTTTGGTVQDEDCRWQKSFKEGCELLISAIDMFKQVADVEVVQIPGNHDSERIVYAGAYVSAWYHNDANVTVNNTPRDRKYIRYGNNLLMLTHGYKAKPQRLFNIMPVEAHSDWSNTTNWEIHAGHVHHENTKIIPMETSEAGIIYRTLSILVEPDAWHIQHGFISKRKSQSFIWHPEHGLTQQLYYQP